MRAYYATYTLPFTFTFYGIAYSTVYVSPTGAIFFNATDAANARLASAPSASQSGLDHDDRAVLGGRDRHALLQSRTASSLRPRAQGRSTM